MAMTKQVLITALFITLFLLSSILLIGGVLNDRRESVVTDRISHLDRDLAEIQTFFLLSETYGDEMACLAFEQKLKDLDTTIWDLGIQLDQYRAASEEFTRSAFYAQQKRTFNENQLVYMTLLTELKDRCGYKQTVIAFFYTNSTDCPKCDDQSAVLTSVNMRFDEDVAIFSYDLELGITSLDLMARYFNVSELPCTIIDGETYCGIRGREEVIDAICLASDSAACPESNVELFERLLNESLENMTNATP